MSFYSKQDVFCPICGKLNKSEICRGRFFLFCDVKCWREFEWRETLSTLGKEYYPEPQENAQRHQSL